MGGPLEEKGDVSVPVECTSEDEVVVYTEFVQSFSEVALVDQSACFVDYNEGVDDPISPSAFPSQTPSHPAEGRLTS